MHTGIILCVCIKLKIIIVIMNSTFGISKHSTIKIITADNENGRVPLRRVAT